jgi:hypothetical protein
MIELKIDRIGYITADDLDLQFVGHERVPDLTARYVEWDHRFEQYKILQPLPDLFEWWDMVLVHRAFPIKDLKERLRREIGTVVHGTLYPVERDNPRFPHMAALECIHKAVDELIENLDTSEGPERKVSFFPKERWNYMTTAYVHMIETVSNICSYLNPEEKLFFQLTDIKAMFRAAKRFTTRLPRRLNWTRGERFPCL